MSYYGYGGGAPGCLFDYGPNAAQSLEDAIECFDTLYELTDTEKETLREDHILYFDKDRAHEVGAQYCQVWEIDEDEYNEMNEE